MSAAQRKRWRTSSNKRPDLSSTLVSYNFESDAARRARDLDAAEALLDAALRQFRHIDDEWGIGSCMADLGRVAQERSDFVKADECYRGGLRIFHAVGHRGGIRKVLEGLAIAAAARQQHRRSLRLAGAAAALWRAYRDGGYRDSATRDETDIESGDLNRALVTVRAAEGSGAVSTWLEGWNLPLDQAVAYALLEGSASESAS